ncbi:hypothetical protein [Enterococcus casseliflavus]
MKQYKPIHNGLVCFLFAHNENAAQRAKRKVIVWLVEQHCY